MSKVTCQDIFNGVYINVKGCYIEKLYSTKKKATTYTKNINEDENHEKVDKSALATVVNIDSLVSDTSYQETVSESLDRKEESEVMSQIRLDLDEKFPYIIASFCSNSSNLDKAYRKYMGLEEQNEFSAYMIEQSEVFPLSERFVYPCIMYVSSMALIDIDEKMSDMFYGKYTTLLSSITREIPFECLKTVEKY